MLKLFSTRTWYKDILMIFFKKCFKSITMQISKGSNKKKFVLKKEILLERRILEAQVIL